MTPSLEGIFVALTTPFEGDRVAPDRIAANIGRLNATGVAGYLVLGSTGESVSLTDAESLALVEAVVGAAAPGKKILVGTAREWTKGTIDFTASLPARGVDAVLVRPPSYFKSKMTREALRAHYLAVAEASRYPVLVYNMPANTGISLEPRLVVELAAHPNIAGLKESSGSIAFLEEVRREVPASFLYFVGSGHVVYPGLEMGASGAILAVANAAPEVPAEIFRLFQAGKKDEARRLQLDLVPLNRALMETYGIAGLKYAQDLRGFYGGPARLPLLPVADAAKAEIAGLLRALGLLTS
ncbi:MAG: dihydrodipicolinate synthase family protein [Acidobacteria bacterium]|jgi:4-hydroxy-2-oxoglutarate aldolase|nr:dihydrodipicolinate synthase family protein [Acidobacteriota bacterium]